jgi:hypothetical protein
VDFAPSPLHIEWVSQNAHPPTFVSERWYVGLRSVGTRHLSARELAWVRRRRRDHHRSVALTLTIPVLLFVGAAVLVHSSTPADFPLGLWGFLGALVGLSGAILCIVKGRGPWRIAAAVGVGILAAHFVARLVALRLAHLLSSIAESIAVSVLVLGSTYAAVVFVRRVRELWHLGRISDDLNMEVAERFSGTLSAAGTDGSIRALVRGGQLDPFSTRDQTVDILPRSGLILRANGRAIPTWMTANVVEVAPPRPFAMQVALPEGLNQAKEEPSVRLLRRSLSPSERHELERHIRNLKRQWWLPALATFSVASFLILRSINALEPAPLNDAGAMLVYILAALVYFSYFRRIQAAHKLDWDRKLRWVVTVHDCEKEGSTSSQKTPPPKMEILPVSRLAWTEGTKPADWRFGE